MFDLIGPQDEQKLQREAMAFQVRRTPEDERVHAMEVIEQSNQQAAEEDANFESFHASQQASRDFKRFMVRNKQYVNCGENTAAMDAYIRTNFDNVVNLGTIEAAFVALSSQNALILDSTKKAKSAAADDLENMSATQLLEAHEKETKRAEQEERADREVWNSKTSGVPAAQRFVKAFPQYIVCPANAAVMEATMQAAGVNVDHPTYVQFVDAFNQCRDQLELDETKTPSREPVVDPYSLSMEELERRAGGFDNGHGGTTPTEEYIPLSGLYRGGPGVGFTFEPGSER